MNSRFCNEPLIGPLCLAFALFLLAAETRANTIGCGGDAFSSAEVVDTRSAPRARPAKRGPVTAAPDTLCADLSDDRPPTTPNIDVMVGGSQGEGNAQAGPREGASARPGGRNLAR